MADLYSPDRQLLSGHFRIFRSGAWGTSGFLGSVCSDAWAVVRPDGAAFMPAGPSEIPVEFRMAAGVS